MFAIYAYCTKNVYNFVKIGFDLYLKMYKCIYYFLNNFTIVRCLDFSKIVSVIFIDWLQTFAFFRKLFEKLKKKNI